MQAFLFAHGASAFAAGIHIVLLAWLGVSELSLTPSKLGIVQASALLPNVLFMLLAGVCADRYKAPNLLILSEILRLLSYLLLVCALYFHVLSFEILIIYAVTVGLANAFFGPIREKLLADYAVSGIQEKISSASIVQFTLQSLGIAMASLSSQIGLVTVAAFQVIATLLSISGFVVIAKKTGEKKVEVSESLIQSFWQGVQAFLRNKALKHLLMLIAFNGFMHMGVFLVALPVMSRDIFKLTAMQYGLLQLTFVSGMIAAHMLLKYKSERVEYPGHMALFSLLYTAFVGFALSMGPTVTGLYLLIAFWGWIAGNSAAHCRMVLQVVVWPEIKGRAMSIYQFVLFGTAPIGALAMGYLLQSIALDNIFTAMSAASVILFVFFLLKRPLWQVRVLDN